MQVDDPHVGPVTVPAPYPNLSHAEGRIYNPAPRIGEHNDEVYKELLGLTDAEVNELTDLGAI